MLLNKHEYQTLFSRVEKLLKLHQIILNYFENENNAWTGKNMIGYVFGQQKGELLKNYVPYINGYDEMMETLNRLQSDPVTQNFLRVMFLWNFKYFLDVRSSFH